MGQNKRNITPVPTLVPRSYISLVLTHQYVINSSPPGQNGGHFAEDIFSCIFLNEKFCILIKISVKFVPKGPIDNNPALV